MWVWARAWESVRHSLTLGPVPGDPVTLTTLNRGAGDDVGEFRSVGQRCQLAHFGDFGVLLALVPREPDPLFPHLR